MTRFKAGDRVKVLSVGKYDAWRSEHKEIQGKTGVILAREEHVGAGYIVCNLKYDTPLVTSRGTWKTSFFIKVKLKKLEA